MIKTGGEPQSLHKCLCVGSIRESGCPREVSATGSDQEEERSRLTSELSNLRTLHFSAVNSGVKNATIAGAEAAINRSS